MKWKREWEDEKEYRRKEGGEGNWEGIGIIQHGGDESGKMIKERRGYTASVPFSSREIACP